MRGLLEEPTDATPATGIGGTITGGTANSILFVNPTGILAQDNANFSFNDTTNLFQLGSVSTAGQAITQIKGGVLGGALSTDNFLNITGTLPSTTSAQTNGINLQITGAGSSSQVQNGVSINLGAGYTGSSATRGIFVTNLSAGTGTSLTGGSANYGATTNSLGVGTGYNIGNYMTSSGSSGLNLPGYARATSSSNSPALNVGFASIAGNATTNIGAGFFLGTGSPTFGSTSVALFADNGSTGSDIFHLRDNGTNILKMASGGITTMTWGATTGAGTNLLTLTDTLNNTGTGSILKVFSAQGSTVDLLQMTAYSGPYASQRDVVRVYNNRAILFGGVNGSIGTPARVVSVYNDNASSNDILFVVGSINDNSQFIIRDQQAPNFVRGITSGGLDIGVASNVYKIKSIADGNNYFQLSDGASALDTNISASNNKSVILGSFAMTNTFATFNATSATLNVPLKYKAYTVATLPTGAVGMEAYVTNALAPVIGNTVVGGGAAYAKVWYNNANWTVTGI